VTTPRYMLNYHVAAMWHPRGETREQCAERAFKWFALMRECDPSFTQWFLSEDTMAGVPQHRVDLDANVFASSLEESRGRSQRWFFQGVWNGLEGDQKCSVVFQIGSTELKALESVAFEAPWEAGPLTDRLVTTAGLSAILRSMVLAWDPEEGVAYTSQLVEAMMSWPREERLGWINYYARSRGPIPPLPPPVRTEPVEDKGTLIILGDEKLSGANPAHVALVQEVSAELKKAGVLKPW